MSITKSTIARPSPEILHALYVEQGLGCPDIGRMFERDPKTVLYWLRCAGIPSRPRGSDPRQHFKAGQRGAFAGHKHRPESIARVKASTLADGRVPYLRDGKHWLTGLPADENPNWKGGATPERQAFYRTAEWKAACCLVWARANASCERCGLDYRTVDRKAAPKFHVHHIVSFQVEALRADAANVALLCRPCHYFVHSNENIERAFLIEASMPSLFAFEELEQVA